MENDESIQDMCQRTPTGSEILHISIKMNVLSEIVVRKFYPFLPAYQHESSHISLMEEKKSYALYSWLIYAEKCCLSFNDQIAGQTGLCNFPFVSEHSVQIWLDRYVPERFLSNKNQTGSSSCCISWVLNAALFNSINL